MTGPSTPDLMFVVGPAEAGQSWARWWRAGGELRARLSLVDVAAALFGDEGATAVADRSSRAWRIADAARIGAAQALLHRGVSVVVDGDDLDEAGQGRFGAVAWACAANLHVVDLRRPGAAPPPRPASR